MYLDMLDKSIKSDASLLTANFDELRRDSGADNSVIVTWQLSFEYLRDIRPSAANLFSLMAFLDHRNIPRSLLDTRGYGIVLSRYAPVSEYRWLELNVDCTSVGEELDEDISILYDFHLISVGVGTHSFEVHPLVQLAARRWLEMRDVTDHWLSQVVALMLFYSCSGMDEHTPRLQKMTPHIVAVCKHVPREREARLHLSKLLEALSHSYAMCEKGDQCLAWARICAAERVHILGDHFFAVEGMLSLGRLLTTFGLFDEAQNAIVFCMLIAERNPDMGWPAKDITANCLFLMAMSETSQWQHAKAELHLRQALELYEEMSGAPLGLGHDMYRCTHFLVEVLLEQGKLAEAEEMSRFQLAKTTEMYGSEHGITVKAKTTLVHVLRVQGRLEEALELGTRLLESWTGKSQWEDLAITINITDGITRTLQAQKEPQKALSMRQRSYRMRCDWYGEENPATLAHAELYALKLLSARQENQALEIMRSVAMISQRTLRLEHENTVRRTQLEAKLEDLVSKPIRWRERHKCVVQ